MNNNEIYEKSEKVVTNDEDQANISPTDRDPGITSPPYGMTKDPSSEAQFEAHLSSANGWVKLSENIYMYNKEPLKNGARVYKGKKRFAGDWRDVAVKLIPYDEKYLLEVKHILKLEDHPNIIRLYDADEIKDVTPHMYIVMELCPQTLGDFIEENKQTPIDFNQRFLYAKQIVAGLAFIHKKDILHRDIKLENILLSPSKEYIRVADFGFSKEMGGYSAMSASTQGLGTEGYRAQELYSKYPHASFQSDSFALGIVLALLFSNGHHPFGSDPNRWRTNILDNNEVDLSNIYHFSKEHSPKTSQLLDLISSAIKFNPEDRPTPMKMLEHPFFSEAASETQQRENRSKNVTIGVNVAEGGKAIQNYHNSVILIAGQTGGSVNPEVLRQNASVWRDFDDNLKSMNLTDDTPAPKNAELKQSAILQDEEVGENPTMDVTGDERDPVREYLLTKRRKIKILENELGKSLRRGEVEKYSEILDELKNLRDSDDLDMVLKLAEYGLMSKENDSAIETVRDFIFASEPRSALDTREKGKNRYEEKHYIQALILHKISRDLHKTEEKLSPDAELKWIKDSTRYMSHSISALIKCGGKSRDLATKHGTKYMEELFDEVRQVSDATLHARALAELDYRYEMTYICLKLSDHEKAIRIGEDGITMMKEQFRENALNYKLYGLLLNSVGIAYDDSGRYSESEHYFIEAIEVYEKASDFESEERKREIMDVAKRNLENTRGQLAK